VVSVVSCDPTARFFLTSLLFTDPDDNVSVSKIKVRCLPQIIIILENCFINFIWGSFAGFVGHGFSPVGDLWTVDCGLMKLQACERTIYVSGG